MRFVQIRKTDGERRVGVVKDDRLHLLDEVDSIYDLAQEAVATAKSLTDYATERISNQSLSYDDVYDGDSEWRLLPAIDHPQEPARCLVSGTGLTHLKSAENRQAMHASGAAPTDSMRMYEWGVQGGKPASGKIGISPEWFYKGCGTVLRANGEPLTVPPHAEDGGEESEIAGIYLIDSDGLPRRLGLAIGNEFSDHVVEKKNYLYLAASKLMSCSIGPELVTEASFDCVAGEVRIERAGEVIWKKIIRTGDAAMCHSLANIEHHHFKHAGHRRPGDIHVHFFGADAFSSGEGVTLKQGDVVEVRFEGFG
ncbi:MAG TPA: AraD1 family protein, partial [Terriglobales bacterium]|nr:AraD1 family protein [Terriglobales bacterium]